MVKPEEVALFALIAQGAKARDAIPQLGIPHRRAWYWLRKWTDRGRYEYGVTLDLGWITDDGRGHLMRLIADAEKSAKNIP